eukprot:13471225-Alexandrium_andersonii.AAC.1
MSASLVGSEMCIRDRLAEHARATKGLRPRSTPSSPPDRPTLRSRARRAVSYTHLTLPTICSV